MAGAHESHGSNGRGERGMEPGGAAGRTRQGRLQGPSAPAGATGEQQPGRCPRGDAVANGPGGGTGAARRRFSCARHVSHMTRCAIKPASQEKIPRTQNDIMGHRWIAERP